MARYEAQLHWQGHEPAALGALVSQLAAPIGVEACWLDRTTVSMPLVLQPHGLTVQVLLECRPHGQLMLLVSSREGMGHGAPATRQVFDRLLEAMAQGLPQAQWLYRSDRDGPIRQRS